MRLGYFSIIALLIAATIAIGIYKAKGISTEDPSRDPKQVKRAGGTIKEERETKAFDTVGVDLSRIGLEK